MERILWEIVGLAFFSLAFVGPRTMWAYLGLAPLLTGLLSFCPTCALFGICTCKLRS